MASNSTSKITETNLILLLKDKLKPLFLKYNIDFAYLAGSWIRNQQYWWSDIDIFVSYSNFLNLDDKSKWQIWSKIDDLAYQITLLDKIELRFFEQLPIHIQFDIIREGKVLFEKNQETRQQFIEDLLNRYYDHKIWFDSYLKQSIYGEY